MDDLAAKLAELEYLLQRVREAKAEFERLKPQFEKAFGKPVEDFDPAEIVRRVADVVARTGNASLAARYLSLCAQLSKADERHNRALAVARTDPSERNLAALREAYDANNDALEEFERVEADVKRWLDDYDPEEANHG